MDCNREEAERAKQLAEKKMETKDFSGALKIAVKAQQLYPELENISQLILVCEVHCSAEKKSYGNDKDWYGILKVELNADDISIKKQYRKLALILHPDKNKFSGSTDAFKLIGEAQRVLLDSEKRKAFDYKRRAYGTISSSSWIPKQPNRPSNVQTHQHPWNKVQPVNLASQTQPVNLARQTHPVNLARQTHPVNLAGVRAGSFHFTQQRFPTAGGHQSTFWTACPFCKVRFEFYRLDVINTVIVCQSCKKSFTAYESTAQNAAAATTAQNHTHTQQSRVPRKPAKVTKCSSTTKPVFDKKEKFKVQGNASRKRKKRIDESSESSDSSESSESEEEVEVQSENEGSNGVPKNVEQPRRSSRAKRNVSYKESTNDIDVDIDNDNDDDNDNDNDDAGPSNSVENEVEGDTFWKEEVIKENNNHSQKDDKGVEIDIDDVTGEEIKPEVFECPDPEFSDFDEYRKQESFSAGQIWACYDNTDAMPRFYAFIKKISPGFKLQIVWLKPDPLTTDEKNWVDADLPVSCGRFTLGKLDQSEDLFTFSHLVSKAGQRTKIFNILPRKGETWALFKNWSMNWHSPEDEDEERKYEYEFVEILSDFDEDSGARVSYLEKVKGFVCLYRRKEGGEMVISGSEKYRFAHMVLSSRMSGEEREGVPKGSYELDPASLPSILE